MVKGCQVTVRKLRKPFNGGRIFLLGSEPVALQPLQTDSGVYSRKA